MLLTISCGLVICLLFTFIFIFKIYNKLEKCNIEIENYKRKLDECVKDYNRKIAEVNKEKKKFEKLKEDLIDITPGSKGIISDYGLTWTDTDKDGKKTVTSFTVNYEVEIMEVSATKFKVNAINLSSFDKIGRDPAHKTNILEFMKDKWIERSKVQIIVDDSMKRDAKLKSLGI